MTTARDLINSSMRLATILASGETANADEINDGLSAFNDILANWSTENLSVWDRSNEIFPAVAGVATYTIGPGADWSTTRPVRIHGGFSRLPSGPTYADFPFSPWSQLEYDSVPVKQVGGIPERFMYLNEFPTGSITFYPVPSQSMSMYLTVDRVLSSVTLNTVLSFPPGYETALRHALAVRLAPEYGVELSPLVMEAARGLKADIKRANIRRVRSAFDWSLRGNNRYAYWQRGY